MQPIDWNNKKKVPIKKSQSKFKNQNQPIKLQAFKHNISPQPIIWNKIFTGSSVHWKLKAKMEE